MEKQQDKLLENVSEKINKKFFINHYLDFKNENYDALNNYLVSDFDTITMVKTINEMGKLKDFMDIVAFSNINKRLREKCFSYDKIDFENECDFRKVRYDIKVKNDLIREIVENRMYLKKISFVAGVFRKIIRDYKKLIEIDSSFNEEYRNFVNNVIRHMKKNYYKMQGFDKLMYIKICGTIKRSTPFNVDDLLKDIRGY